MADNKMPGRLQGAIEALACIIMAAYALVFFGFGVNMLQRVGVSMITLVPTFLGVLLGFLSARLGEWLKGGLEKRKRRVHLCSGVTRSLERNLGLLHQVNQEFSAKRIPSFPMDCGFLEYASPQIHELIPDLEDAEKIEHARYEIRHFDIKLEMLRDTYSGQRVGIVAAEQIVVASNHTPIVRGAIEAAMNVCKQYVKTD